MRLSINAIDGLCGRLHDREFGLEHIERRERGREVTIESRDLREENLKKLYVFFMIFSFKFT